MLPRRAGLATARGRPIPALLQLSTKGGRRRARIPALARRTGFEPGPDPVRFFFQRAEQRGLEPQRRAAPPASNGCRPPGRFLLRGKERTRSSALARRSGFQPRPGPAGFPFHEMSEAQSRWVRVSRPGASSDALRGTAARAPVRASAARIRSPRAGATSASPAAREAACSPPGACGCPCDRCTSCTR